jgi:2'-5' RNA ligase
VSAFPPEPPSNLDDPTIISAHDWRAFQAIPSMENHWQRPGWTPERRSYHWLVTVEPHDALRHLVEQCQAQLTMPTLDHVPVESLHITVRRVGFTDEITEKAARQTADEAVPACRTLSPFKLHIGPLAGSPGAIRFSVAPWTPLLSLHSTLTTATKQIHGDHMSMDTTAFRPHLSIAYANSHLPPTAVLPLVAQLRQLPTATALVDSVALVKLRRDGRTYRFDVLERVQLGQARVYRPPDSEGM